LLKIRRSNQQKSKSLKDTEKSKRKEDPVLKSDFVIWLIHRTKHLKYPQEEEN
jgi:hypothetical protein